MRLGGTGQNWDCDRRKREASTLCCSASTERIASRMSAADRNLSPLPSNDGNLDVINFELKDEGGASFVLKLLVLPREMPPTSETVTVLRSDLFDDTERRSGGICRERVVLREVVEA